MGSTVVIATARPENRAKSTGRWSARSSPGDATSSVYRSANRSYRSSSRLNASLSRAQSSTPAPTPRSIRTRRMGLRPAPTSSTPTTSRPRRNAIGPARVATCSAISWRLILLSPLLFPPQTCAPACDAPKKRESGSTPTPLESAKIGARDQKANRSIPYRGGQGQGAGNGDRCRPRHGGVAPIVDVRWDLSAPPHRLREARLSGRPAILG